MAPTVLREGALRLFFFSREETRVRVRVSHPSGGAEFWLAPSVWLANHVGLNDRQLRHAQAIVEAHLEEIVDAWHQHFVP